MSRWDTIEAILSEIEQLDKETRGRYRQYSDREALDVCARMERKIKLSKNVKLRQYLGLADPLAPEESCGELKPWRDSK